MSYQPVLYIGIGATNALFTLRETYEHILYIEGKPLVQIRSFHHKNLGAIAEESFEKAMASSKNLSLPLNTTIDQIKEELREIKHRSKEEMESAAEAQRIANAESTLSYAADNDYKLMLQYIKKGGVNNFSFGKYFGKPYVDIVKNDREYVDYILENVFSDDLGAYQLETIIDKLPPAVPSEYVGEVGERYAFNAIVKRYIPFETQYGTSVVVTLADDEGNDLVLFTTADFPEVGVPFTFAAKVKEHKEYNDVKQTVLQRPTKIKEVEDE